MRIEKIQITTIVVPETTYIDTNAIHQIVENTLTGSYALVFPKTNILFVPKSKLSKHIKETYTAAADVSIKRKGLQEIEVVVEEHAPYGVVCLSDINKMAGSEDLLTTYSYATGTRVLIGSQSVISRTDAYGQIPETSNCFYFNENTYIFTQTDFPSRENKVVSFMYAPIATSSISLGKTFFDADIIQTIRRFNELVQEISIIPETVWTKSGEVFTIQTKSAMKLHIDPTESPEQMFQNLETLFDNEVITKEDYGQIDYVDLRFGNRVFYREVE